MPVNLVRKDMTDDSRVTADWKCSNGESMLVHWGLINLAVTVCPYLREETESEAKVSNNCRLLKIQAPHHQWTIQKSSCLRERSVALCLLDIAYDATEYYYTTPIQKLSPATGW